MSNLIRVSESDDWIVDYDRERGMYRVSYFKDCHFVNEYWFDAYEEKEISLSKALEKYKLVKYNYTDEELKEAIKQAELHLIQYGLI